jgi:hypothetical protein
MPESYSPHLRTNKTQKIMQNSLINRKTVTEFIFELLWEKVQSGELPSDIYTTSILMDIEQGATRYEPFISQEHYNDGFSKAKEIYG